ncbi:PEP-CTERM sorting domain-containing protein [Oopsacas minuta]|uniref:PEP-CTERM sorting domain-containing protein n=1 Tax=Oopsacas minuta TaxID=111878 RepID=A0AAV7K2Q2_9METZ|nr:PEP-CTERM sorting domain-containing protein [Oopsacas minuta]
MCDNNKLLNEVNKFGRLVKLKNGIDYTTKIQPVISVCDKGNGNEQLNNPRVVTVDNRTGYIYVTDQYNNCVKVFDNTAKIGTCGEGELEFYSPYALTIDKATNDIFICDYSNHRVQILSKEFSYKAQFGIDTLRYPLDVKLSHHNIYVLDCSNPCIHLSNNNLMLQKCIISRGAGNQVVKPYSFFVDTYDNILRADYDSNCKSIFNAKFESIHKITVPEHPTGIIAVTTGNQHRIIVVCNNTMNCLQIF